MASSTCQIVEVEPTIVEAFLGTIEEPPPMVAITPLQSTEAETPAASPPDNAAFRASIFTDVKGSTAFTNQLGDARLMDLLRIHNSVVREALKAHGGREVKHTGDGLMGSFTSVASAVECAIAILRALEAHKRENPNTPIDLRIGLSAGEPLEQDQDLFGATVQLAARLCQRAEANRILVSGVVQELCLGKNLPFKDQGRKTLKGFDRPVRVYEVEWSPA
ncbi:MAG: adenylate/guanylate cyclase domain-containing protein [Longimicrobiales bacterium]